MSYELFEALDDGEIEQAKLLMFQGEDIHRITESEEWSYFHKILSDLDDKTPLKSIRFLLEQGLDVNAVDAYGNTPLIYAVRQRNVEGIKLLLANGADNIIDHENIDGVSALRMAFIGKPSLCFDGVTLLLKHGASPDTENKNGKTVRERLGIIVGVPLDIHELLAKY